MSKFHSCISMSISRVYVLQSCTINVYFHTFLNSLWTNFIMAVKPLINVSKSPTQLQPHRTQLVFNGNSCHRQNTASNLTKYIVHSADWFTQVLPPLLHRLGRYYRVLYMGGCNSSIEFIFNNLHFLDLLPPELHLCLHIMTPLSNDFSL